MTAQAPSQTDKPGGNPRQRLEPDECRAVLGAFGMLGVRGVRDFVRGNPGAPKALVDTDSGRFLLKRRAPGLDNFARVQTEHAVQVALQQAGRPVPAPLASRDGETIVVRQSRFYELYPFIDAHPWTPGVETARVAGEVLAGLHDTLGGIAVPPGTPTADRAARVARAFEHLTTHSPELRSPLERLRHDWEAALNHRKHLNLHPHRLTHGDYHPGNTLWRGERLAAVIDFETMRPAPYMEEAALAALHFALDSTGSDPHAWPASPDIPRLEAFWAGFNAADRLEPALIEAVPGLMVEGLIAEALPRACRSAGFGRHETGEILPFIARTTAWLCEHAEGLGVILLQAGR